LNVDKEFTIYDGVGVDGSTSKSGGAVGALQASHCEEISTSLGRTIKTGVEIGAG